MKSKNKEEQEENKQDKATVRRNGFKIFFLRNLAGILSIVWMCIIFAFSAQSKEESSEVSESFTYQMVSSTRTFFHLDMSDARVKEVADAIEGFVRKAAHMTEYGILSVLLFIWMGQWEMSLLRRGGTASGAAAVYAATDEIHQFFVEGRAGRFSDVCIDSAGAVLGIFVFVLAVRIAKLVKTAKARRQEREERKRQKIRQRDQQETLEQQTEED